MAFANGGEPEKEKTRGPSDAANDDSVPPPPHPRSFRENATYWIGWVCDNVERRYARLREIARVIYPGLKTFERKQVLEIDVAAAAAVRTAIEFRGFDPTGQPTLTVAQVIANLHRFGAWHSRNTDAWLARLQRLDRKPNDASTNARRGRQS